MSVSSGQTCMEQTNVVVIGAGLAGIAACREIVAHTDFDFVCLERRLAAGGLWNIEDAPKSTIFFDNDGRPSVEPPNMAAPPSPMYSTLRTNVPSDLMCWPTKPYRQETPVFPRWDQVLEYLQNAARDLPIRYLTMVTRIRHSVQEERTNRTARRWVVEASVPDGDRVSISCDYLFVCNGHYSRPWIPPIPGLWTWTGMILHAQYYRRASDFDGLNVVVIGNGASGYDITRELAERRLKVQDRSKIYNSASHPPKNGWAWEDPAAPPFARRVTPIPRIRSVSESSLCLETAEAANSASVVNDCSCIIFCTGYLYDFEFIHETDAPWDESPVTRPPPMPEDFPRPDQSLLYPIRTPSRPLSGLRVHSLDSLQMFHRDPTCAFLGLQLNVVPGPLISHQARTTLARWAGQAQYSLQPLEDETTESHAVHMLIPPREFDWMRKLVELRGGEGREEVPDAKYRRRESVKALRLSIVG